MKKLSEMTDEELGEEAFEQAKKKTDSAKKRSRSCYFEMARRISRKDKPK